MPSAQLFPHPLLRPLLRPRLGSPGLVELAWETSMTPVDSALLKAMNLHR